MGNILRPPSYRDQTGWNIVQDPVTDCSNTTVLFKNKLFTALQTFVRLKQGNSDTFNTDYTNTDKQSTLTPKIHFTNPTTHIGSCVNTSALTSILSRGFAVSGVFGSVNAVCGVNLARPSNLFSKHLIK